MGFIVKSDPFSINIQRINFVLELAEAQFNMYSGYIAGVLPKNANTKEETTNTNREEDKAVKMCKMIVKIKSLQKIVDSLKSLTVVLTDSMKYIVEYAITAAVEYVIKKIQILALKIKRLLVELSIKIAKMTRSVLIGLDNKCGSGITAALNSAVVAIMAVFKALAFAVYVVMLAVKLILDMMPTMISVSAESMCFFLTPKSVMLGLSKVEMTCANPNKSICNRLPTAIKNAISTIEEAVNNANNAIRIAMIATGAALGLACAFTQFNIPDTLCKVLKVINPKNIIKGIDFLLTSLAIPDPLPKYEKLLPINLGYLAWLIIGFCPAGKKAFGIPGFP